MSEVAAGERRSPAAAATDRTVDRYPLGPGRMREAAVGGCRSAGRCAGRPAGTNLRRERPWNVLEARREPSPSPPALRRAARRPRDAAAPAPAQPVYVPDERAMSLPDAERTVTRIA